MGRLNDRRAGRNESGEAASVSSAQTTTMAGLPGRVDTMDAFARFDRPETEAERPQLEIDVLGHAPVGVRNVSTKPSRSR